VAVATSRITLLLWTGCAKIIVVAKAVTNSRKNFFIED
jgi:hypothetical protein